MKRISSLIAAILFLLLALACGTTQTAEGPDASAPTDMPEQIDEIAAPDAETVSLETPAPTPEPTPTPSPEPKPLAGVRIGLDPGHQQRANYNKEPVAQIGRAHV